MSGEHGQLQWDSVILDASKLPDEPLQALYQRCFLAHRHLSDLPRDAQAAQQLLRALLRMLQHCDVQVDAAALFSANEEEDDIQTSSLRCAVSDACAMGSAMHLGLTMSACKCAQDRLEDCWCVRPVAAFYARTQWL